MTLNLLRKLNLPNELLIETVSRDEADKLYEYSSRNRMRTSFLEKFACAEKFPNLRELYWYEETLYLKMLKAVSKVSKILTSADSNHAIFKTVRPYKSTTVDIDTVIFGDKGAYNKALNILKNAKYALLAKGPLSATFWDSNADIGIDVYDEIGVSALCYLDKNCLTRFERMVELPNGENARLLGPEADLLTIVAHSIIKEQMYTLSEYYSFVKYLEIIDEKTFLDLLRETNLMNAGRIHGSITALIFEAVHGKISSKLQNILGELGQDNFETSRMQRRDLESPYKYHPITVSKSLLEIAKGKKTRSSAALQLKRMTNPSFTSRFLKDLLQHLARETY